MDTMTLHRDATGQPVLPGHPTLAQASPTAPTTPNRIQRLWRGPSDDPAWARPALLGRGVGVVRRPVAPPARVVDQHVDTAEGLAEGHEGAQVVLDGDVAAHP